MPTDMTPRDAVWLALWELDGAVTIDDVRRRTGYVIEGEPLDYPGYETVRRVLAVAAGAGVVAHEKGSRYYKV